MSTQQGDPIFSPGAEEEEEENQQQTGGDTFQQVRQWGKQRDKAAKTAEKTAKDEKERADKLALRVAKSVFSDAGLHENLASLYSKLNPGFDPDALNKEAVIAFAKENGIPVSEEQAAGEQKAEGEQQQGNTAEAPQATTQEQAPTPGTEAQQQQQPAVKPQPGSGGSIQAVKASEIAEAARKGDNRKVLEIIERELATGNAIQYAHPEYVNDET